jgi:hypothetical protein
VHDYGYINNFFQETTVEATKQKEKKRGKLSPRNSNACQSVSTALLKSLVDFQKYV